ncbi:ABC transporter ATP-binding protein [Longispora sp. NPDC051575]|uniref:ABC transporter ATP-binding protein n=1 Tax=Longispora sp. NPDC051575 TaxID=3154943 RepID=UPI003431D685
MSTLPTFDVWRPVRVRLWVAGLLQAVSSAAGLVPYLAVVELARRLLAGGRTGLWTWVLVAAVALAVRAATTGLALTVSHLADADLQYHLRSGIARRLGTVPLGWFTAHTSGEVKKAVQDDVHSMHSLVAHAALDIVAAAVTPVLALGYLFWVDWRMALVTTATLPVYLTVYAVLVGGYQKKMAEMNAAIGRINTAAVEFVSGIAVVKTFGGTRRASSRFAAAADDFADRFRSWVGPMTRWEGAAQTTLMPVTVLTVVLAAGTAMIGSGTLTPANLLPFVLLGLGFGQPLLTLGFGAAALREARAAATRVRTTLDTPPLPVPATPRVPDGHEITFRNVTFGYAADAPVLHDVSLTLRPGTVTALVGPSGSGKSTLARLLPRFFDPDSGTVTLGGVDVRDMDPAELYRHVGLVFQDVQLLRTSVRDNIRLGRPDAADDEVRAAAKAAQIHDRITELPDGYDTVDPVLSGGEAQRVSIARALLADTPVLVLDEATAYADPECEAAVQDALSTLVAGRTVLVIAHRLHTVTGADQIAVLDDGRIVQCGRHPDLLAADGLYRRLWDSLEDR